MANGPSSLAAGQRQGNLWGAEATQTASWGLLPRHITGHPKVVFISLMWPQTRGQGSQLGTATLALRNELSSHSPVSTALLCSYNKWTMTLAQVTSERVQLEIPNISTPAYCLTKASQLTVP